jgi:hypothetical protein
MTQEIAFAFEWYSAPRKTLSVSVDDCGNLHYAALLGPDSVYGTEAFVGVLPKRILDLIYQVKLGWPLSKAAQKNLAQEISAVARFVSAPSL